MPVRQSSTRPTTPSSRSKLLNAAAELMRENGYAAVTSRRVAAKAGLKPQLVHYYFRSMDDFFVALYREWATSLIERQEAVIHSEKPLREMWKLTSDARGVLLSEFIALANHRESIKKEIAKFGKRFRQSQIRVMEHIFEKRGIKEFPWTPALAAVLLNSLARGLTQEVEVGVEEGHVETRKAIEHFIDKFDL